LGYAVNWGRVWSLWPVHLETACCSVEFGAASGPKYDVERFGIIEAFGSLRQCDLIVVQGTVTRKMAPRVRMVYDQMPEPKYVIAMGACAITGGLYIDSYNVLPGIDGIIKDQILPLNQIHLQITQHVLINRTLILRLLPFQPQFQSQAHRPKICPKKKLNLLHLKRELLTG
jgi:Ni,Fe-hydrogenase III small subunit